MLGSNLLALWIKGKENEGFYTLQDPYSGKMLTAVTHYEFQMTSNTPFKNEFISNFLGLLLPFQFYKYISKTSLLMHTVAYSIRLSFRPKISNQLLKKFLSLAVS